MEAKSVHPSAWVPGFLSLKNPEGPWPPGSGVVLFRAPPGAAGRVVVNDAGDRRFRRSTSAVWRHEPVQKSHVTAGIFIGTSHYVL